ncbi:hypothetical protein AU210_016014 [Fusarium oxysporum f. sp. radicis-cucumerinum]|uniref:Zn(2)-C6 fungal-type domain-containing protein n=2 Tax=Fusarium oxysporum TaxID=5507 RepID=A0A2H3G9A8_FUSOX|nr:hypothetical protein AU210_016014 [Fusarium oxysporum f. sp. radicis-cucumerinum]
MAGPLYHDQGLSYLYPQAQQACTFANPTLLESSSRPSVYLSPPTIPVNVREQETNHSALPMANGVPFPVGNQSTPTAPSLSSLANKPSPFSNWAVPEENLHHLKTDEWRYIDVYNVNQQSHLSPDTRLFVSGSVGPVVSTDDQTRFLQTNSACPGNLLLSMRTNNYHLTSQGSRLETKACIACWLEKKACKPSPSGSSPYCSRCAELPDPRSICINFRVIDLRQFQKWSDTTYETMLTVVKSTPTMRSNPTGITLCHYQNGPVLNVKCLQFEKDPDKHYQYHALRKNWTGWHMLETTAYCLQKSPDIEIRSYVQECVEVAMGQASSDGTPASLFIQLGLDQQGNHPLIKHCLELLTALRLLRVGWQFSGEETLGMSRVLDEQSAFFGTIPVPRMIQNQLNHLLEKIMEKSEKLITGILHGMYRTRKPNSWFVATLGAFLLLHARELDAGRLLYWNRNPDEYNFWIHPWKPSDLIQESMASHVCLLRHHHLSLGLRQLDGSYDLGNASTTSSEHDNLQRGTQALRVAVEAMNEHITTRHSLPTTYVPGDPSSVSLSLSSRLFGFGTAWSRIREFD